MLQCAWLVALILILSTVGQFPMDENTSSSCEIKYNCFGKEECTKDMVEYCSTILSDPSCSQEDGRSKDDKCGLLYKSATSSFESTPALCPNNITQRGTTKQPSLCDCCKDRINKCATQFIEELNDVLDDAADPTNGDPTKTIANECTKTYEHFVCAQLLRRGKNDTLCGDFCCRIRLKCPFLRVEDNQLYGGQPALSCEEESTPGCFSYSNISNNSSNTTDDTTENWSDPCSSSKGSDLPRFHSFTSTTILISLLGLFL